MDPLIIYTDGSCLGNPRPGRMGWKRKNWKSKAGPAKNQDLWQRLDAANDARRVTWRWVRGHCGNAGNEVVDSAARETAERIAGEQ